MATPKSTPARESTRELLADLNASNAAAAAESAPAALSTSTTIPAGNLKLIVFRPAAHIENGGRAAGAVSVPEYLVIEKGENGRASFHHAYSFAGSVEPRVYYSRSGCKPYDWIPNAVPNPPCGALAGELDWKEFQFHLTTHGALTLHIDPAARVVAQPTSQLRADVETVPPIPAIPIPDYTSKELFAAVSLVTRIIGEASPTLRRSGHATHAAELARNLAASLYGIGA